MDNNENKYQALTDKIAKLEAKLAKTRWLHGRENIGDKEPYVPFYGDLTELNIAHTILDMVGKDNLKNLTAELMYLLDTSVAVYEKNGDYAYGEFDSAWCRLLDASSRELCNTDDNKTALNCGKWLCHEDCWNNSAKAAIVSKRSTDIDCIGGIKLFAEPIFVGNEVIGTINIGYGNPPVDDKSLKEISIKYGIDFDTLEQKAKAYNPRPDFIIEIAKKRLKSIARLIGEIVSREQAEQTLKENQEKLDLIINESPFPLAIADLSNEKIHFWSQNAKKMFGHSPKTVSEWSELAYPDPEYRRQAVERWEPLLATARESETAINTGEYNITCKDGSIKTCEIFAQFIPENIVVTFNDITDRKKAEHAIKESEANLSFLNTMVNEAFYLEDLNAVYHYISSKLAEILPNTLILFLTIDSECKETRLENFHGINNHIFKQLLNVMPFNPVGKSYKLLPDLRELHNTGKLVEFKKGLAEFSKSQLSSFAANSIEKIIGIHRIYTIGILRGENLLANFHFFTFNKKEITNSEFIEAFVKQAGLILQIKQAELKLKEANATKDRFISILGHDLRNPFNALLGFSDILIQEYDQFSRKKIKEHVETINKASKQTFNLLNNLLEWSRSQRDGIPFNPRTTNLYFLVYETYMLLNEPAEIKQITVDIDVAEKINAKVDGEMIKTVIRNLLSNAIKFTPENGKVRISARKKQESVQITISDTGIGMDRETLDSLFKVGKTISKTGTKGEGGTGFGLLLCKEFIEKHRGKIWVESEMGKGSSFNFSLPL